MSFGNTRSFKDTKRDLANRIDQALGNELADLVIKNVSILNVVTGEITISDIAITNGTIVGTYNSYHGRQEIDGTGKTAVAGFIDSHVHVESSMIAPLEFDRCVLPYGTTTAICDPHEMANVLGGAALRFFQKSAERTIMDLFVQVSSCVPATPLETSGARIEAAELSKLSKHSQTLGLAELMNIGGVLGKDPQVLDKVAAFQAGHIDGHLPGISDYALNAMLCCGIRNCHESTTENQALEKLRKGVQVFIREGTVCKDMAALQPLITTQLSPFLGFCTDDRNPLEIAREGHINHLIRTAIRLGSAPKDVYRIASWSAAQGFGLHRNSPKGQARGLIAPGYKADIVLLNNVETCDIDTVIKNGKVVTEETFKKRAPVAPIGYNSIKIREIAPVDFKVEANSYEGPQDVIGLIAHQIMTEHLQLHLPQEKGYLVPDPANNVLKISVIERHGKNGNIAVGFVKGFDFKSGAIASSVGHDSHNITVVGATDEDMALAVNTVRANQGGFAVVKEGQVVGSIALPIAGLMSDQPYETVRDQLQLLDSTIRSAGFGGVDSFMALAFLPLSVIPNLKLTDFGLVRFSPQNGDQGPVLINDQRNLRPTALPGPQLH